MMVIYIYDFIAVFVNAVGQSIESSEPSTNIYSHNEQRAHRSEPSDAYSQNFRQILRLNGFANWNFCLPSFDLSSLLAVLWNDELRQIDVLDSEKIWMIVPCGSFKGRDGVAFLFSLCFNQ